MSASLAVKDALKMWAVAVPAARLAILEREVVPRLREQVQVRC
jgi:hypothetical protein